MMFLKNYTSSVPVHTTIGRPFEQVDVVINTNMKLFDSSKLAGFEGYPKDNILVATGILLGRVPGDTSALAIVAKLPSGGFVTIGINLALAAGAVNGLLKGDMAERAQTKN